MPSSSWRPLLLLDVVLLVLYLLSFSVALLRVVSIVSSYRDRLCHSHRLPQLGFLVLAALAAAVRCLAILLRELLPEGAPGWQLGLEAAPDALLVAAVSFLVYKFADIYHGILNSGSSRHKKFLKAFVVALLASNAALISVIAACWLSKAKATQEDDESISRRFAKVTQSCIAVSFLLQAVFYFFYGFALYGRFQRTQTVFHVENQGSVANSSPIVVVNPVRKILKVCILCCLCFSIKVFLLIENMHRPLGMFVSAFYYICTEVIPMLAIMLTFSDTSGGSNRGRPVDMHRKNSQAYPSRQRLLSEHISQQSDDD